MLKTIDHGTRDHVFATFQAAYGRGNRVTARQGFEGVGTGFFGDSGQSGRRVKVYLVTQSSDSEGLIDAVERISFVSTRLNPPRFATGCSLNS